MRYLRAIGRFWYDFLIGDDWKIAVAVLLVLVPGALLVAATGLADSAALPPVLAGALVLSFVVAVLVDVRSR